MTPPPDANPLAQFRQTYFEECAELLDALQSQLEQLSNGGGDEETLHAIFRCVHSIKGGAGAFGFAALVAFSHVLESLLDAMRDKKIAATTDVVALLLRASDALADIVSAARDDRTLPADFASDIALALEDLLLGVSDTPVIETTVAIEALQPSGESRYRIAFTPHSEMLQKANEPLLLIRQLRRLGGLTVEADTARIPPFAAIEPEAAYLSWIFTLDTGAPQSAIDEVFEFVEDDCDLSVQLLAADAPSPATGGRCCSPRPMPRRRSMSPPRRRFTRSVSMSTRSTGWSIWSARWSSPRQC